MDAIESLVTNNGKMAVLQNEVLKVIDEGNLENITELLNPFVSVRMNTRYINMNFWHRES